MAPVRGHFLAGDEDDREVRQARQLLVMGGCVVIGDGEEVEAFLDRVLDDLLDRIEAIGVKCVAVEIALQPAARSGWLIRWAIARW